MSRFTHFLSKMAFTHFGGQVWLKKSKVGRLDDSGAGYETMFISLSKETGHNTLVPIIQTIGVGQSDFGVGCSN